MFLLLALACGSCGSPTPAPSPTPLNAPVRDPNLKPATSLDFLGLNIGKSTESEIQTWISGKALTCKTELSPRRTTTRYICDGAIPASVLTGREIHGNISQILWVRGDTTPLIHGSATRRYSIPTDAETDYNSTIKTLTAQLGEPTRPQVIDPAKLNAPLLRYATTWAFADLDVSVTLIRMGTSYITIDERWDQPGAELQQADRVQNIDRSKCKDPFCFDQPGMAPPGMRDPFGFDKTPEEKAAEAKAAEEKAAAEKAAEKKE